MNTAAKNYAPLIVLLFLSAVGVQAATYNVRNFGAKADKTANDAPASPSSPKPIARTYE